jgi:hypothetical protein
VSSDSRNQEFTQKLEENLKNIKENWDKEVKEDVNKWWKEQSDEIH